MTPYGNMKSHHALTTCPGCGCAEGEPPNDECWPCQTDGEARLGEPLDYERSLSLAALRACASASSTSDSISST